MIDATDTQQMSFWIEQLAQYGPYALFVFFALILWTVAKRNIDTAKNDKERLYYQRNHRIILYGVFVLATVLVIVWVAQKFFLEHKSGDPLVKGYFSGLKNYSPLGGSELAGISHSITLDQPDKFYSKIDKGLSDEYRHEWVLINDQSLSDFYFVFQQVYEETKPSRMTDSVGENQSVKDRRLLKKRFKLSFTDEELLSGLPYHVLYMPDEEDPIGKIGRLKRQVQGEESLKEIPWLASGSYRKTKVPIEQRLALFPQALAAGSIFAGQDRDYVVRKLNELLSSENLKDQLDAQRILMNNLEDASYYVRHVLSNEQKGISDQFTYWSNVQEIIERLDVSNVAIEPAVKVRLASQLISSGAYEQASNFYKKIKPIVPGGDEGSQSQPNLAVKNQFEPVALNRLSKQVEDNWINVPYLAYERLRVAYYMSPMVFYGNGCIRGTYKGGDFAAEEKRPRYSISLWRDDKRQGYEFFLSKDAGASNRTEFTVYKRFSASGSRPVTKLNRGWQSDEKINGFDSGENTLSICRKESNLYFLVNGKEVFKTVEEEVERHRFFGMNVSIGTQVFVKDFGICLLSNCGYNLMSEP
ncbi:hypothetical protein [Aliikangiella coralliicola]|uniref:Uncharacterized protein n=1 Tax=Aliikangiella coralliicola TaxID=2592383 RepID=A0A545UDS4_9GAMM|nr:hypothetical protein [Aliikangiella coralliicola]TQV87622.1 hypothetical protein FLL46_12185 [Aliikangiella coralliicola]